MTITTIHTPTDRLTLWVIIFFDIIAQPAVTKLDGTLHDAALPVLKIVLNILIEITTHSTNLVLPNTVQSNRNPVSTVEQDFDARLHLNSHSSVFLVKHHEEPAGWIRILVFPDVRGLEWMESPVQVEFESVLVVNRLQRHSHFVFSAVGFDEHVFDVGDRGKSLVVR